MIERSLSRDEDCLVTQVGLGCAPLGELFTRISEQQARATLLSAWEHGVRFFDTSPFYGHGKSEHRLGSFLREMDANSVRLSTKVGRLFLASPGHNPTPWVGGLPFTYRYDYSYSGILRSWEDSLQRLGLDKVDFLVVHDLDPIFHTPEAWTQHFKELENGGWSALAELKASGAIRAIGIGINCLGMIPKFLASFDPDFFLVAMPYTLLEQEVLTTEFPACESRSVNIVIGAVFASGILQTGTTPDAKYAYADAPPKILEKARAIEDTCREFEVELAAAALQFPLAHPAVAAIIPGALEPGHIDQNFQRLKQAIPSGFWSTLKARGLLRKDAPCPEV